MRSQPVWVTQAKSKPFLDTLVARLEAVLPDDIEPQIRARILGRDAAPTEGAPAQEQPPAEDAPATNN